MIKLKRVYEPVGPDDGRRFLVDRIWPRGVRKEMLSIDAWLKEAGPSTELRKWFGHDPSRWAGFGNATSTNWKRTRRCPSRCSGQPARATSRSSTALETSSITRRL